ncbi:unnamed protein product, partial [Staurois parvus]
MTASVTKTKDGVTPSPHVRRAMDTNYRRKSPHCGRGRDTNYWGKSPHCRRGRDNYCREISPLWEVQRHQLLQGNLPIVGGAETQTTAEKSPHCGWGRDTNYWGGNIIVGGAETQLLEGNIIVGGAETQLLQGNLSIVGGADTQTTAGKSPHCGRGRDRNYCREISPLWEGQRHKTTAGKSPHC